MTDENLMPRETKMRALRGGEVFAGVFWPAGDSEREADGFLRWSGDGGALVELITPRPDWPGPGWDGPLTIHGELRDLGEISLLWAWLKSWALGDQPYRYRAPTLAFGTLTTGDERWPRAIYSSGHLSEWRRDTGIVHETPRRRGGTRTHTVHIERRDPDEVTVPGARLRFGRSADYIFSYSPRWSVTTRQDMVVDPVRPRTLSQYRRDFADPLAALTALVGDTEDGTVREVLLDPDARTRIEVWQSGAPHQPVEWLADARFLFHADELPDFERAMRRWWKTYRQTWPALGVFSSQYADGNIYSPARLITVYAALESYARARHGHTDLRRLRTYSRVGSETTGCTNKALTALGVARGYFAHYKSAKGKLSAEELPGTILPSIRKASALMQACMLREFGFSKIEATELLDKHYAAWPLT